MDRLNDKRIVAGVTVVAVMVGAAAMFFLNKRNRTSLTSRSTLQPAYEQAIAQIKQKFEVPTDYIQRIKEGMESEFKLGLSKPTGEKPSSIKMLPSFIDRIPTGHETGISYALDIGGSNLRTMKLELDGHGKVKTILIRKSSISHELQTGDADALFDFIAASIGDVVDETAESNNFGFTFSFPVDQTDVSSGKLIKWTKGFQTKNVEGQDVVELLNNALERSGIRAKVTVLINDTVGTLISSAYDPSDGETVAGVILGTGTNASYIESKANIEKLETGEKEGVMVINTEWGNFDSPAYSVLEPTEFDLTIDKNSPNFSCQHFEKMVSGMYLGEIVRLALVDFAEAGFFSHRNSSYILTPYRFGTEFMSEIERDDTMQLIHVDAFLKRIDINNTSYQERKLLKELCHAVALRSARLVSGAIAAIVDRMGKKDTKSVVAIDGALFEHYPGYAGHIEQGLKEIGYNNVVLKLIKEGSGYGAAIAANVMSSTE